MSESKATKGYSNAMYLKNTVMDDSFSTYDKGMRDRRGQAFAIALVHTISGTQAFQGTRSECTGTWSPPREINRETWNQACLTLPDIAIQSKTNGSDDGAQY